MDEKKKEIKIKYPKTKIYIAIILLLLLVVSYTIQFTILIRTYIASYIVSVVLDNTMNILVISSLLIFINILEIRAIKEKIERN